MQYVMHFRFVDDVMTFRTNERKSETTRMFRRVRQVAALEVKSAVSDCILYYQRFDLAAGSMAGITSNFSFLVFPRNEYKVNGSC